MVMVERPWRRRSAFEGPTVRSLVVGIVPLLLSCEGMVRSRAPTGLVLTGKASQQ